MSFKRLDPEDISISAESIVSPAWSTDAIELVDNGTGTGFFLNTNQTSNNTGTFYYEVYHKASPTDDTARVQFSIAYGHLYGSGSHQPQYASVGFSPSKAIYSQYANLYIIHLAQYQKVLFFYYCQIQLLISLPIM